MHVLGTGLTSCWQCRPRSYSGPTGTIKAIARSLQPHTPEAPPSEHHGRHAQMPSQNTSGQVDHNLLNPRFVLIEFSLVSCPFLNRRTTNQRGLAQRHCPQMPFNAWVMNESTSESSASACSVERVSVGSRKSSEYSIHNVPSWGQQLPTSTVNSVGRVLLVTLVALDTLWPQLQTVVPTMKMENTVHMVHFDFIKTSLSIRSKLSMTW